MFGDFFDVFFFYGLGSHGMKITIMNAPPFWKSRFFLGTHFFPSASWPAEISHARNEVGEGTDYFT